MGCFPCFDSKEEEKLNTVNESNDPKQAQPTVSSNISSLSSGGDRLRSRSNGGSKRELPCPRDGPGVQIAAHIFSFRELAAATKNFRPESFLGEGGFGHVYKGQLESTGQVVAVKQLDRNGLQGNREFLVEVLMLSLLHHPNLVNLIGYCADGDQRLLVYEFMPLGSLEDHLHDLPPGKEPLDWNTRMKIAAGAAKGLEYLHDKANPPVIYRDFKSSNILLEEGFHPKLSDFGLAKLGPVGDKSHVSTRVMGTYGYCAPEYAMTGQLTVKSDVYSFGVVFLELITGRKAIDSTRPHGEQNLITWARPLFTNRRKLSKLADPLLQGRFPMRGLYQALAVASMCIQEEAAARPHIGDVVTALSYLANQRNRDVQEPDEKVVALRRLFSKPGIGIDAYIIPSQDAHQSEFIAECYMRRAYISGFTGSAGTAVVTKDKAALWTDGRYFLQAEKQLSSSWILMRAGSLGVPTTSEWLNDVLSPGGRVGIDPFLFSHDAAKELKEAISKKNLELVYLYDLNPVDEIWKESRPKPPNNPIRVHDMKYAGLDVASKLSSLRAELVGTGASAIVISMLDEVAWLLNLRGSDVPHSPVMYAYLIVEVDGAKLFVDNSKVTKEVMDHLKNASVELRPYDSILSEIRRLAAQGAQLWLDTSSVNAAIVETYKSALDKYRSNLGSKGKIKNKRYDESNGLSEGPSGVYMRSPISLAKALKNPAELEGMQNCHLRDAAALAQFWCWLEEEIHNNVELTEVDVADKLLEFRAKKEGFLDTSFDTISGSGANGAIIHYRAEIGSCSVVDPNKLFLLDSGAQYIDGTTDITRTVHFGEPTAREKECFTRVLKGHIALDQAVFPENTPGFVLDAFARSSLWKIGLDYRHGTGHGVGAALNVHEGPQSISYRYGNTTPLQKGMIVSNEPGYYEDHAFGIRIENLLHVQEINTPNRYGGIEYLGFEKLTFFPIQAKLVDISLISDDEIEWLNNYHSQVWEKVSPLVEGSARQWLWNNTRVIHKQ